MIGVTRIRAVGRSENIWEQGLFKVLFLEQVLHILLPKSKQGGLQLNYPPIPPIPKALQECQSQNLKDSLRQCHYLVARFAIENHQLVLGWENPELEHNSLFIALLCQLLRLLWDAFSKFRPGHTVAQDNLSKIENFLTNTTTASKYILKRPKICIS